MKKHLLIAAAGIAVCALSASTAFATDTTDTTPSTVPVACVSPAPPDGQDWPRPDMGPARAPHTQEVVEDFPDCSTIDGICIILTPGEDAEAPAGPGRTVHVAAPLDPCEGTDLACVIEIFGNPGEVLDVTGPARITHSPAVPPAPTTIVKISSECQDVLSESIAIPATGSNSGGIAMIAALLVGIGGTLVLTQRRLARR
jgi:hypothetical protein